MLIVDAQVQGMSFLAGVLLLNLDEAEAFLALANLLNRPLLLAFYRLDNAAVFIIDYLLLYKFTTYTS